MNISKDFEAFPDEGMLIGRILLGYSDLEIDLMRCINAVRSDPDAIVREMYRDRGEHRRLRVAVSLH
jgi:hypothetical protein